MLEKLEERAAARNKAAVRESSVEGHLVGKIKDKRGLCLKFTSPGRRGVPDRLTLMPIPPEHQELVRRYVRFAELKRPGGKPRPEQEREHQLLRHMGFHVDVFSTKESIDEVEG